MKLKLSASMVALALLSACGGGGSGETATVGEIPTLNPSPDVDRDATPPESIVEDRTRPASGQMMSSDSTTLKFNGTNLFSDSGDPPIRIDSSRAVGWPGLRYGDFYVSNNPWNYSSAGFPSWYQEISLYDTGAGYGVQFNWDWGSQADTTGNVFDTKSYPEVIYGTKSPGERSGTFAETGLPVEIYDAPVFTIDYNYTVEGRASASAGASPAVSEYNVAIESFYHETCDIKRSGQSTDNVVFETMVWLRMGQNKPSGEPAVDVVSTSDGRMYDVYTKVNSNKDYIAYVAKEEQLSGTVLYSELLDHAKDNAGRYGITQLEDSHCLANILMGTEIWYGAGTFNLNQFTVNRAY